MNKTIAALITAAGLVAGGRSALAQDVTVNVTVLPAASIAVGDTALIKVDIINLDMTGVAAPANKIRPLISIPSGISIIPNTPVTAGLGSNNPDGWTVVTNSGSSIRVINGNTIPGNSTSTFYILAIGTAVGGPQTITTSIGFNGPQTLGNQTSNDNNISTLTVTSPLPVTLASLTATAAHCAAILEWTTGTEKGFSHFDVERSTDGSHFIGVGTVRAKGDNSRYSFLDEHASEGQYQYRLKMTDQDGSSVNSIYIPVSVSCGGGNDMSIFPNPATDVLNIKMADYSQAVSVKLSDIQGRVVYKRNDAAAAIPLKGLAQGTYLLEVVQKDGTTGNFKVVKQ